MVLPVLAPAGEACCPPLACEPLSPGGAGELAALFKAVADPARLRLLSLIACHPVLFTWTLACVSYRSPWMLIDSVSAPLKFEPDRILNGTVTTVPSRPITSTGSCIGGDGGGGVGPANVTMADADFVGSVEIAALIVTACCPDSAAGAV